MPFNTKICVGFEIEQPSFLLNVERILLNYVVFIMLVLEFCLYWFVFASVGND